MKIVLTVLLLLQSATALSDDKVVAEVDGKKIYKSTLLKYHSQNLDVVNNKKVTKETSLNHLIDRIIGINDAKKEGFHKKPEVIKKMNDIVYHSYVSKELSPLLKKIKVSDRDIKQYYNKFPEYKTSQILLRVRTIPSADEVAKMYELAQKLYKQLNKSPDKFAEVAKKHSQTQNAKDGGALGFQPRVRLSQEFFESIHKKKPGHITQPFRTQYGFHIVKVEDIKSFKDIDLNLYKKIVYDYKRDEILEDYFAKKRKSSKVKVFKNNL